MWEREYKVLFVISKQWDWGSIEWECQNPCEKEESEKVKSDVLKHKHGKWE